jgi:hypothetical protein
VVGGVGRTVDVTPPARAGHTIKPVRQVARRTFESMYMGGKSPALPSTQ